MHINVGGGDTEATTRPPWRHVAFVGSVALAIVLGTAGCGDDDDDSDEDVGAQVSEAIEDADLDEAECLLPDDVVADIAGDGVTQSGGSVGGSGGTAGDVEYSYSYEGCDYELATGGELKVAELVDTNDTSALDSYEQVAGLVGVDDDAVAVADLGDGAVQLDEELLVLSGDRAFLLEGETETGDSADPSVLQALAAALIAETS